MHRLGPLFFVLLGLAGHLGLQAVPAWDRITEKRAAGRDFASYYYASRVALAGGDPYENDALSAAAKSEHTRSLVQPYFYPPPFLLTVAWVKPFSLKVAYETWFFVNELCLLGCLAIGVWAFGVPWWAVCALLWTWSPIPDNAWMGQANLLALLPALLGLAAAPRRPIAGGVLVGAAAMLKMSPALFLGWWALRGNWRAIGAAIATALALSLAVLPIVGWDAQVRFYTEVLPGFPKGDYHGLTVPISLEANHSIPDLYDRLFPNAGAFLSDAARRATTATSLGLLALWAWRSRRAARPAAALGALAVLMVVVPVYTYEHHLVFLVVAAGTAAGEIAAAAKGFAQNGRMKSAFALWGFLVLSWFFLAWPLAWLRAAQAGLPSNLHWLTRESKTFAEAGFFLMLLWAAGRRTQPGEAAQQPL